MSEQSNGGRANPDVSQYPCVQAWHLLDPTGKSPTRIEVLQEAKKARLYRMHGVGPGGGAVVAKRCRGEEAIVERTIYGEILPSLPIPSLRYYGTVREQGEFCWLFLEDAGGKAYSSLLVEHRACAARWLGLMHLHAEQSLSRSGLPQKGPTYYLEELRAARDTVPLIQSRSGRSTDDVVLLKAMVAQIRFLESHWNQIEQLCEGMPQTLVHGDLSEKNVRLRGNRRRAALCVFDWEIAGWGSPAIDLAQFTLGSVTPDILTYCSVIRPRWPHLDVQIVRSLAHCGTLFRIIDGIYWEICGITEKDSRYLEYEYLKWTIHNLRTYSSLIDNILRATRRGRLDKAASWA